MSRFYSVTPNTSPFLEVLTENQSVLPTDTFTEDKNNTSLLPQSISITRIEELLEQMRIKEVPKRSLFSIPLHLAEGFTIGVKGYVPLSITEYKSIMYSLGMGLLLSRRKGHIGCSMMQETSLNLYQLKQCMLMR